MLITSRTRWSNIDRLIELLVEYVGNTNTTAALLAQHAETCNRDKLEIRETLKHQDTAMEANKTEIKEALKDQDKKVEARHAINQEAQKNLDKKLSWILATLFVALLALLGDLAFQIIQDQAKMANLMQSAKPAHTESPKSSFEP